MWHQRLHPMIRGRAYASAAAPRYAIYCRPLLRALPPVIRKFPLLCLARGSWFYSKNSAAPHKSWGTTRRSLYDAPTDHVQAASKCMDLGIPPALACSSPPFVRVVEQEGGGEDEEIVAFHGRYVPTRLLDPAMHACMHACMLQIADMPNPCSARSCSAVVLPGANSGNCACSPCPETKPCTKPVQVVS